MYKILVADDERWIRKGITRMIDCERFGVDAVLEADTVESALEVFQRELPDIVLSDVMFPTENGCDFGDLIYAMKRDTKIVMISAYDDFEYARRALRFSAVDYLLKPVSKEKLNDIIARCIALLGEERREAAENQPPAESESLQPPVCGEDVDSTSECKILEIVRKIGENYAKRYVLSEMAAECCITETYFSTLFKRVTGLSPVNYIAKIRVDKAKELILTTEYKMVRIANMVGYTDYQYFVKVFKKVAGVTPGEYKAGLQNDIDI